MRAKVYDKARTAVRRQLESMNPRPSDEMLTRQLDKLDSAIAEVEMEYSDALPAMAEPAVVVPPVPQPEPEPEPVVEQPVAAAPVEEEQVEPEPVAEHAVAQAEPEELYEPPMAARRDVADELPVGPAGQVEPEMQADPAPHWPAEPQDGAIDYAEEADAQVAAYAPHEDLPSDAASHPSAAQEGPAIPEGTPLEESISTWERYEAEREHAAAAPDAPVGMAATGHFEPAFEAHSAVPSDLSAPEVEPYVEQRMEIPHEGGLDSREADVARDEFDLLAHSHGHGQQKAQAPSLDLLQWEPESVSSTPPQRSNGNEDAFAQWFAENAAAAPSAIDDHLDDSGDDGRIAAQDLDFAEERSLPEGPMLAGPEQKPYVARPVKKKRSMMPLLLGLVVLLAIAGGGYAAWSNRDTLEGMLAKVTGSSGEETAQTGDTAPTTDTTEDETPPADATADTAAGTGAAKAPALADGETSGKFTQRLNADGTEVDEGEAPSSAATSGSSVAQQTVASNDQPAPSAQGTPAAGAPTAGAAPSTAPAASEPAAPVEGQQKALLYEERIGQATPTAHAGHVEWKLVSENGDDGRPQPEVQGKVVIPDSGLSALITFKRNADNSLPASHLIEIVFSVPANFEGGAIQDVQRVAMKTTEQDRGDPLVAVPARITDDTFLVALNDFKDVVQRNIDLMRDRDWIDIPVTYRNGRRALFTLDKGATGKAAFDQAIKEWAALGTSGG